MWDNITLKMIGAMIVSAGFASVLTRWARIPHIVLYILTGLLLARLELAFMEPERIAESQGAVDLISESGIALLLFLVGMELNLTKVKDIGKEAFICGLSQILICAGLAWLLAYAMGFGVLEAMVLGIAMTFSSTVIVVKLLTEKRHQDALYGKLSIGILLVQDMVVILVLTVMAGLGGTQGNMASVGVELGKALVGVVALFALAMGVAKYFISRIMSWASSSTESLLVWSLTWCFLIVSIAHSLRLSHEIGAFIAGVSLAQLSLSNSLKQRVHPLMNFFMGIFFISLGMEIDFEAAFANWREAAGFTAFVLFGKSLAFFLILSKRGFPERTSFLVADSMCQISEFSFLFIALASQVNLADGQMVAIVALTGLSSFVISSFLIARNRHIYRVFSSKGFLRPFKVKLKTAAYEFPKERRRDHVVVIGMNALGREICSTLEERGIRVLALDNDPKKLDGLPCETLVGNADYASILDEASFSSATLVVTTLRIEDVNNSIVYRCRQMGIPVAAHGFDSSVIPELKKLGADYVIDTKSSWLKRLIGELEQRGLSLP